MPMHRKVFLEVSIRRRLDHHHLYSVRIADLLESGFVKLAKDWNKEQDRSHRSEFGTGHYIDDPDGMFEWATAFDAEARLTACTCGDEGSANFTPGGRAIKHKATMRVRIGLNGLQEVVACKAYYEHQKRGHRGTVSGRMSFGPNLQNMPRSLGVVTDS